MYKVAISIGDTNGIGAEIAIKSHAHIQKYCAPIYCVHEELLESIAKKLGVAKRQASDDKAINSLVGLMQRN